MTEQTDPFAPYEEAQREKDEAEAARWDLTIDELRAARAGNLPPDEYKMWRDARSHADVEAGHAELERQREARAEAERQARVAEEAARLP